MRKIFVTVLLIQLAFFVNAQYQTKENEKGAVYYLNPVFAAHGYLKDTVASGLLLKAGISVTYKAGNQPNNALSLNVLNPGEAATTAGTSGVIYGVCDKLNYDLQSRSNSFAPMNHEQQKNRIGVLLCIDGAGIYRTAGSALQNRKPVGVVTPADAGTYKDLYVQGKERLSDQLNCIRQLKSL